LRDIIKRMRLSQRPTVTIRPNAINP